MPIQVPQWPDYLNCPVCFNKFTASRSPISLKCGHTICKNCVKHLLKKECPFDEIIIQMESDDLVVNTALLKLAGYAPPAHPHHPPCIAALQETDKVAFDVIVQCMEYLANYLKYSSTSNNGIGSCLSRSMQRKLVTLLQCAITDEEGRSRAMRAARSLGERIVNELLIQNQNQHMLSAHLWAAVRARGCQFLGPAMQEEVLKLILLALEDGSPLSRKILVMFVVQKLGSIFPQASKTSIGHVVQLLYRASCFMVSKRIQDSSLMQLKEEFRTYESLRREHDAQIVQIATEAGLRIAPDQWSSLLYGDTSRKSHMQSIIDKLQNPQSFSQSIKDLFITLQRNVDSAQLVRINYNLDCLASIDPNPDAKSTSWQQLAEVLTSLKEVVWGLLNYLRQQAAGKDSNLSQKLSSPEKSNEPSTSRLSTPNQTGTPTHIHSYYRVLMCSDARKRAFCPRGSSCTFVHADEELELYQPPNGTYPPMTAIPPRVMAHPQIAQGLPQSGAPHMGPVPVQMPPMHAQPMQTMPLSLPPGLSQPMQTLPQPPLPGPIPLAVPFSQKFSIPPPPPYMPAPNYALSAANPTTQKMEIPQNMDMQISPNVFFHDSRTMVPNGGGLNVPVCGAFTNPSHSILQTRPELPPAFAPIHNTVTFPNQEGARPHNISPCYDYKNADLVSLLNRPTGFPSLPPNREDSWSTNNALFTVNPFPGADVITATKEEEQELEQEMQALERRIDTEF